MANSIFKKGYEVNRENVKRQEKARENMGKKLFDFFLSGDGEEANVRFLTEEPINYEAHVIQEGKFYNTYTCTGKDCPFCAEGDRSSSRGAFLIVDKRPYTYTDKKTGEEKTIENSVKFYSQGTKVVSQLDRLSSKYGITNRDVTIVRLGSGTATTYTFERGDEDKMSEEEISELLPEKLRGDFDGTMESLYRIVEEQLIMRTKDYNPADEDEEEEVSSADKIISADEEEEKKPKKSLFKKSQNSLKPRAKELNR